MINPFQFNHPAGVQISPGVTELAMDPDHKREDHGNGWTWYCLPVVVDGAKEINFRLGFEDGILRQVEISDVNPNLGTSWDEWSKEKEEIRARNIASWLTGLGFPLGEHSWGTLWCGYDERSSCGLAIVRYGV